MARLASILCVSVLFFSAVVSSWKETSTEEYDGRQKQENQVRVESIGKEAHASTLADKELSNDSEWSEEDYRRYRTTGEEFE